MTRETPEHTPLPLKDAIREEVTSEQLAPGQLHELLTMQQEVLAEAPEPIHRKSAWLVAAAACLMVIAFFGWQHNNQQAMRYIALEVAENHLKLKPMDVETQSMGEIRQYFTQLDFSPARSSLLETTLKLPEKFMLGGRYCSIKGVTAAQLRYRKNDIQTLYQVPYDEALHGDIADIQQQPEPQTLQLKGLEVQLWREHGLLMVLVKKP